MSIIHGTGLISKLTDGKGISGTIATSVAVIIFITSIDYVRRNYFNVFLFSHVVFLPIFIFFCVVHGATIILFPFIITLGELLLRCYYNFALQVKIEKLQVLSANVIRIQFDKKKFTYEAGQYVFICIPAVSCMFI